MPDGPFLSFKDFKKSLLSAHRMALLSGSGSEPPKLAAMREHLVGLYSDVEAEHSFVDANGQIFDCVPIGQQPGMKTAGAALASPADLAAPADAPPAEPGSREQPAPGTRGEGNAKGCPAGTVPMRRVTMEELSKYESLQHFFRKAPRAQGRTPQGIAPEDAGGVQHKYAHASQVVPNLGGHSFLNIWAPDVGDQEFSLSQHWYVGGEPVQTVECGWQVYPRKYLNRQPVLFIYWTADGYNQTGNYNLDKQAFIQTNNSWAIGGALDTVSQLDGQQFELEVSWHMVSGNWWLYLNGTTAANAVGYYPGSLFNGGQMSRNAERIDYGGETVNVTQWPKMGSGEFATGGYAKAAYHRNIFYFAQGGGAQSANLQPEQLWPGCYTIEPNVAAAPWNSYFYFGGPGAADCPQVTVPVVAPITD